MAVSKETNIAQPPLSHKFYRQYYRFFIMGIMVLILILMGMIGLVFYQIKHRPLPTFYARQPDRKMMELTPFTTPNLLPDTIITWSSKAATSAYTFNYVNYNDQLVIARQYFTDAGWQVYLRSVSDLINTIRANQLFVNGVVAGTPVIVNQGPLPGRGFVWRVQIPFLVTYQSASGTTKQSFVVIISLVRVPTEVNPQGIGIDQFIMVPR